jgi:hypothetical protein
MGGEYLGFIRKVQELLMQALVEHRGELLRGAVPGKVGAADVSDK